MFQVNPLYIFIPLFVSWNRFIFAPHPHSQDATSLRPIEALQRIQIPLTTYVQFLCTHLGYTCQLYRLRVCRLWPWPKSAIAHFCTACHLFLKRSEEGGTQRRIYLWHEKYMKLKFWWAETKFYWNKSMPIHLCTTHSGFTATTEKLRQRPEDPPNTEIFTICFFLERNFLTPHLLCSNPKPLNPIPSPVLKNAFTPIISTQFDTTSFFCLLNLSHLHTKKPVISPILEKNKKKETSSCPSLCFHQ